MNDSIYFDVDLNLKTISTPVTNYIFFLLIMDVYLKSKEIKNKI